MQASKACAWTISEEWICITTVRPKAPVVNWMALGPPLTETSLLREDHLLWNGWVGTPIVRSKAPLLSIEWHWQRHSAAQVLSRSVPLWDHSAGAPMFCVTWNNLPSLSSANNLTCDKQYAGVGWHSSVKSMVLSWLVSQENFASQTLKKKYLKKNFKYQNYHIFQH